MNEQQRRIAEYVARNAERMPYLTVDEIAGDLGVSIASVSRFARFVGYDGFKQLKSSFRDAAQATPRRKLEARLSVLDEADLIGQHIGSEIGHLDATARSIDRSRFDRAIDLLTASRRLFVYAAGPNEALSHLLSFRFGRFGYDVRPIGRDNARLAERVAQMREDDCLVCFGFFRESDEATILLKAAGARGVGTILITDLHVSTMGEHAEVVIRTERGRQAEYHSLTVPVAVIDCLILGVARRLPDETTAALDNVTSARAEVERLRQ